MHAEPLRKCLRPTGSNVHESSEERASFANKDITILPDELLVKIFSNLDLRDLTHCQLVNRRWQELMMITCWLWPTTVVVIEQNNLSIH